MDYRKNYTLNILKDYLKPQNVLKILYKPHKIPQALKNFYLRTKTFYSDIKFKPQSVDYLLNVYKHSISGLSVLAANKNIGKLEIKTIQNVIGSDVLNSKFSAELGELFKKYGSDKSTVHDYYLVYADVLEKKAMQPINILEIGLGTNNIDVLSNMGLDGKPGASLRAFRDACVNANVFGADIDKRILFTENRIKTFYIDQTIPATFVTLRENLSDTKFDLIIDDGLHNSEANINTLNFALDMLKDDGVFIIEDISVDDFDFYQIIAAILGSKYSLSFIKTKSAYLCLIYKS